MNLKNVFLIVLFTSFCLNVSAKVDSKNKQGVFMSQSHPNDVLLKSRMDLDKLVPVENIKTTEESDQQNEEISKQLKILEELYELPNLETGMRSAITDTYFQYFKKARELYVQSLNIGLKESDVNEETLHYLIKDNTLSLYVVGMFNEQLTKEFLQPVITNTAFTLGFEKIFIVNPKSSFKYIMTEQEWKKTLKNK